MTTVKENPTEETKAIEETKTEFTSFCGFDFDSAKNSDCHEVCSKDEPEEFAKCLAHFETLEVKPKTKTSTAKGGRGKSFWGHINGTQAGLIDDALVTATTPSTLEAIVLFSKGRTPRVLAHIKYLVTKKGATISLTKDNCIFWNDNPNMKGLKAHGCVTGLSIKKAPKVTEEKKEGVVTKDAFKDIKIPADKKDKPVVKKKKAAVKKSETDKALRDAEKAIEEEEKA
jgi:hypothetical protein